MMVVTVEGLNFSDGGTNNSNSAERDWIPSGGCGVVQLVRTVFPVRVTVWGEGYGWQ